jgi:hypothetical protein
MNLYSTVKLLPLSRVNITDQLIAHRRKEAEPKPPAPKKVSKSVSNTDRSVATSRAKRGAAMDKRRGQGQESKPTAMQVDNEVSKQVKKTVTAKAKKQATATTKGSVKTVKVLAKGTTRRERQEATRAVSTARKGKNERREKVESSGTMTRAPTKKAVTAAVTAMEQKGFSIPQGMQMVISFAPAPGTAVAVAKGGPQPKKNQKNVQPKPQNTQPKAKQNDGGAQNNTGRSRRGGGGGARNRRGNDN